MIISGVLCLLFCANFICCGRNLSESRIHLRLDEVEYLDTTRFEGVEFPVPSGYDTYLTRCYGDYRTFPPEEERQIPEVVAWSV